MKNILSKENIASLVLVIIGVSVAVIFVIPFVRNFLPKRTTTTTTAAPTS
jgi:hypothetical protein